MEQLQRLEISYQLDCVRDAIMVIVPTPSKYYEIEFFADGHIETQLFGPQSSVQRQTVQEITEAIIQDVNG
ncbi:hypothetical protein [Terracidiphilus gabretensis]|uniref:hypothetical protein n=1 Tax=Terracidiphilus gabretensis TaxID=1577687 RepID=UPI00071BDA62|nr:hypothetical protein [Terracidiphilus gabretensis]